MKYILCGIKFIYYIYLYHLIMYSMAMCSFSSLQQIIWHSIYLKRTLATHLSRFKLTITWENLLQITWRIRLFLFVCLRAHMPSNTTSIYLCCYYCWLWYHDKAKFQAIHRFYEQQLSEIYVCIQFYVHLPPNWHYNNSIIMMALVLATTFQLSSDQSVFQLPVCL